MARPDQLGRFERLARQHHAGIYNYLRWLCRDADLAEDLTQLTFVQIWGHPPEMRGERALRAWVYRIARNEYLQHHRRARPDTVELNDSDDWRYAAPPASDPIFAMEQGELRRAVQCALGRLPEAYREVIALHNLEGLSLDEVAGVLGIPKGTVKSRRARAFGLLREMLAGQVNSDEVQPSTAEAAG